MQFGGDGIGLIRTKYICGLDIGQAADFTALCVLERLDTYAEPEPNERINRDRLFTLKEHFVGSEVVEIEQPEGVINRTYRCRHLQRFPIGTKYPVIVEAVKRLFDVPPLDRGRKETKATLVIDRTGVGRPVTDMFAASGVNAIIRPITITGGNAIVPDDMGWHVPKKELVGVMQMLLSSSKMKILKNLPDAAVLVKELENFRVKVKLNTGNETYSAWREGVHDDIVLAMAIAAWVGEHGNKTFWMV